MGAPRKDPQGTEIFSFSAPSRLARKLRSYQAANRGGFSTLVCTCLETKLGLRDRELLNARLQAADLQIIAAERELLLLKEEKAKIEVQLRELDLQKDRHDEARFSLLEKYARGAINESWLTSRTDVLVDCDFDSPDEALAWCRRQAEVVTR